MWNTENQYGCDKDRKESRNSGLPQKPPCPFSRASYGEPGLRSPGHWCLLSTRLLPVSHGGCEGTWPTHDVLQPQVIHTWNRGRELRSSDETQTSKTAWKSTQLLMLTRPTCSKHITSAKLRSLGAAVTVCTGLFNPDTHLYLSYRPVCTLGTTRLCVIPHVQVFLQKYERWGLLF